MADFHACHKRVTLKDPDPSKPSPRALEEELFTAARDLPADGRAAFLEEACRGDSLLLRRVTALLAAHDRPDALPEPPDASSFGISGSTMEPDSAVGRMVGRYRLLEQIGEGGCGVVYRAEQTEPLRRQVALKLIKPGMDTRAVIARFEAERQALALMDHPNIATVLDGGTSDDGRPFFVMELVNGVKVTTHCDDHRLDLAARLRIFVQVCQALHHAHQRGVVHRDLKPSNVLVSLRDGVAVPKVIDFGIAKAIGDQPLTDKTIFTVLHHFIGTPAYMSPEQAEHGDQVVDARTDVYSLGVLLYDLLTGHTPFESKQLLESGYESMLRTIREEEPMRPSNRLATLAPADATIVASARQSAPPQLLRQIRGDLDWITLKCLEKSQARRYPGAGELAEDVLRHLGDRPVVARPPGLIYRLCRFVKRHRPAITIVGAAFAGLVFGVSAVLPEKMKRADSGAVAPVDVPPAAGNIALRAPQQFVEELRPAAEEGPTMPGELPVPPLPEAAPLPELPDRPGATLVVGNSADSGEGSFRDAVGRAEHGDTINFAPALSGAVIEFAGGQVLLDKNLIIDGSSLPKCITFRGNGGSRLFEISRGKVVLDTLHLTGGNDLSPRGGGAILSSGNLTLNRCTLTGNTATLHHGGAIYSDGPLTLHQCTVTGNKSKRGGGGVAAFYRAGGSLTLNQCTLTGNSTGGSGADFSGGDVFGYIALVTCFNSIASEVHINQGRFVREGVNLIQAFTSFKEPGVTGPPPLRLAPMLAELGDHGGPVPTMPPVHGSPVVDTGSTTGLTTDQRGLPRVAGPETDIGAVEFQDASPLVTRVDDSGPGSLREAVAYVPAGSTITFAAGLSGATIPLTGGELLLTKDLVIDASSLEKGITIDGGGKSRVFRIVEPGLNIGMSSLTIANGLMNNGNIDHGAGILNFGNLTMNRCRVIDNRAFHGGGIYSMEGEIILNDCTISGNATRGYGAGIHVFGGRASLNRCTLSGNYCLAKAGGAIFNSLGSTLDLVACTLTGNSALKTFDEVPVHGGALFNQGSATLVHCTVTGNAADQAGGILNEGALTLLNCIVAGNTAGDKPEISGEFDGRFNFMTGDPVLAPLGDHGGPTLTMPPLPGSPAIDAAGDLDGEPSATDQRGLPRKAGARPDLGAVEKQ